ncbi:enolase C-terminal domain-like protein [Streptomyces sp. NBC_01304]|uniref:enolase C-terminal domain-like protein n=1 Tax=Streptomyces sp. NBC_01304 TaxID=2903818 RepID=UPI002E15DE7C|nr:hypothetical protein OG430_29220 [Streptomyces sp. NBC_01304]
MTAAVIEGARLHAVPVTARTTWLYAEVTGPGVTGWGELSDIPAAAAEPLLRELAGVVRGLEVADAERKLEEAVRPWTAGGDRFHRWTVLGGLATAVADAAARAAGEPLAEHLGAFRGRVGSAPARHRIPLYANINRAMANRTPEAAAQVARRAVAAGFGTVKCAPFDGLPDRHRLKEGLEIARAVRDAIGPERQLLLDAHHLVSVEEVVAHADEFVALCLGWLEDAAPLGDVRALRRLADATGTPLAGGEFAATAEEVRPALASGALAVLMPDVKHAGGPRRVLRLAALAADHGVALSPHNPSGPVATAASAHLAALLPDGPPLETMFGEVTWRGASVSPYEPLDPGTYALNDRPGLGLTPKVPHVR